MQKGWAWLVVIILFSYGSSVATQLNEATRAKRMLAVFASMRRQETLFAVYNKRCKQDLRSKPKLVCGQCKQQKIYLNDLIATLLGTMLRNIFENVDTYDVQCAWLMEAEQLLQAGSEQQIKPFMLSVSRNLPCTCIYCHTVEWQ